MPNNQTPICDIIRLVNCKNCNNPFKPSIHGGHPKQFCNRSCKDQYYWKNIDQVKRQKYQSTHRRTKRLKSCVKCNHPISHRHHIIPSYKQGANEKNNYIRLCANCHEIVHILYRINDNNFVETLNSFLEASLLDSIEIIKSNIKPLLF